MNYEQKYKEALKRAKVEQETFFNLGNISAKTAIERIFPELKENEDEIMKEVIHNLIVSNDCTASSKEIFSIYGKTKEDCIAWLEKQGEQKPIIIIPQFKVGDIIKPKPYNEEHLIKDINENGYVLDVDIIIPFKDEDVWEIVEQKPTWSEEDEIHLKNAILSAEKEWGVNSFTANWLKSIKDRVQPHPISKWSEEDNERLLRIYQFIWANRRGDTDEIYQQEQDADWLMTLKPHWKPSEGQMETLKFAANDYVMEQEEKDLLIKDLFGRLPYGIFVKDEFDDKNIYTIDYHPHLKTCKPYLRPMSSMTEEEKEELENIEEKYFGQALDKQIKECLSSSPKDESRKLEYFASSKIVDYLNKHYFDYRGLIQIGLAIEASKDIYKIE